MRTRKKSTVGRKYTVYYVADKEAGVYTAHIPALGIVTEGQTLKEAREMARDAIEGRLAVLEELGQPIPRDVKPEHVEV
jgi:predicted RNase H-like HicB family nuclease